ncbi:glycosyltransferase [Aquihabitans daechungensis]|uniref:glycosyltransferase n=1 Tax=Aquihabitans daechungensis TaxID=1052257 RepID=UPI003B9EDF7E
MDPIIDHEGVNPSSNGWHGEPRSQLRPVVELLSRSASERDDGVPTPIDRRRASWQSGMPSVTVVIPTLNEAMNLPHVLPRIPAWVDEVLIVDGRSTDGTIDEARRLLPDVTIVEEPRPGKGRALLKGFRSARSDIVVALDADGSMAPEDIPRYVYSLMAGADLVKGSRFLHGASTDDMGPLRRLGNRGLTEVVRQLYGGRYSDLCYGYFALWTDLIPYLEGDASGFEIETHISVRALAAGLEVVEVPTFEAERIHGVTNLNTIRDGCRVLRTIFSERHAFSQSVLPVPRPARGPLQPAVVAGALRPSAAPAAAPTVTAVVCTHDLARWPLFAAAVESLQNQTQRPDEIVVVVDHNEVLERVVRAELPAVTVLANRYDKGLSGARNTAVEAARHDVVVFLDDDARAEDDWIERLVAVYEDPLVVAAGGAVDPEWETGRPSWFPEEFDWVVGCTYRGLPSVRSKVRNVIGANMSFRRSALELAGGFSADLGRVGADAAGCEETELCIRISQLDANARIVFEPAARVLHRVPADRSTVRYFARRCAAEGRSKAQVSEMVGSQAALASERAYVTRTLPAGLLSRVGRTLRLDHTGVAQAATLATGAVVVAANYARAGRRSGRRS